MRNGGRCKVGVFVCVAALVLGACGGDDGDDEEARATVPESSTTSTESTTTTSSTVPAPEFEPLLADPELTPEEQVEAAYLFSWDIYLDALERARTDDLPLGFARGALELRTSEIEELAGDQSIVRGSVEHDISVTVVSPTEAVVFDTFQNHLVLHDALTGEPLEADPNVARAFQFILELQEDRWLVTRVDRV